MERQKCLSNLKWFLVQMSIWFKLSVVQRVSNLQHLKSDCSVLQWESLGARNYPDNVLPCGFGLDPDFMKFCNALNQLQPVAFGHGDFGHLSSSAHL